MRLPTIFRIIVLTLLVLIGFTGCQESEQHLPKSLRGEVDAKVLPMRTAIDLTELEVPEFEYQVLTDGQPEAGSVSQWTLIEQISQNRFHCLEVYDVFEYENGQKDYAVLEYTLDLQDTSSRAAVLDYRFRANADTAFYTDLARRGAQLRKVAFEAEGHTVYELASYEYYDSPDLSRLTYWTPAWGAILIYGGNKETFELVGLPDASEEAALEKLRKKSREMAIKFDQ